MTHSFVKYAYKFFSDLFVKKDEEIHEICVFPLSFFVILH